MAGLGFAPADFELFEIDAPEQRTRALERQLCPKLSALADGLAPALSRVARRALYAHPGRLHRKKGQAPVEAFVAFSSSEKGYRTGPHFALAVSCAHLHARVAVCGGAEGAEAMARALDRDAPVLAKKGKPFRKLRHYAGWSFEELPELAPAHCPAFWTEVGAEIAGAAPTDSVALGIAWNSEESRSLSMGDLLGAYRDLAPVYKLLASASAGEGASPRTEAPASGRR